MSVTDQPSERDEIPAHLTKDPAAVDRETAHELSECEFYCRDCGLKITRSSRTGREYGHRSYPHCEHHVRLRGER